MSIQDIFCQDRAINRLQRAYAAGKLAHAYIFSGLNGVGKFATAREWAKVLLCSEKVSYTSSDGEVSVDSCGVCESCNIFESEGHPDFTALYKELIQFTKKGKGKTTPVDMPIDVIREFLISKVASRPVVSDSTVFVVSEAERLNNASQNALLKVLEEPPGHCFIILICSRMDKLLATTLSRCQVLGFGPVDEERIVEKLSEMGVRPAEARYWARFSRGSIGAAMDWASLEMKDGDCYEIKKQLVKALAGHELGDSVELADQMSKSAKAISSAWSQKDASTSKTDITRRAQKGLIEMVVGAFSDVMKLNIDSGAELINSDQMGEISALAGKFDSEQAAERISKAAENIRWVESSVNEKLIFEELLLSIADSGII